MIPPAKMTVSAVVAAIACQAPLGRADWGIGPEMTFSPRYPIVATVFTALVLTAS